MDSIKEGMSTSLKEPRNESELLLNQVAEENEDKDKVLKVEKENSGLSNLLDATDYHAAWGYESEDDDLVLFGVGGPA